MLIERDDMMKASHASTSTASRTSIAVFMVVKVSLREPRRAR